MYCGFELAKIEIIDYRDAQRAMVSGKCKSKPEWNIYTFEGGNPSSRYIRKLCISIVSSLVQHKLLLILQSSGGYTILCDLSPTCVLFASHPVLRLQKGRKFDVTTFKEESERKGRRVENMHVQGKKIIPALTQSRKTKATNKHAKDWCWPLPIGVRTGSATKISPCVTTTWEGSIRGQGSAILRISTRWNRFREPASPSPMHMIWKCVWYQPRGVFSFVVGEVAWLLTGLLRGRVPVLWRRRGRALVVTFTRRCWLLVERLWPERWLAFLVWHAQMIVGFVRIEAILRPAHRHAPPVVPGTVGIAGLCDMPEPSAMERRKIVLVEQIMSNFSVQHTWDLRTFARAKKRWS